MVWYDWDWESELSVWCIVMWLLRSRRYCIPSEDVSYTRKRGQSCVLKVKFVSPEQYPLYWRLPQKFGASYTTLLPQNPHSEIYSTVPSRSSLPFRTFSPFAFNKSSIVRSLPSSVLSLNQPRWSAIKCLMVEWSESFLLKNDGSF